MKGSKKHVSCKRLCFILLAISSSCVWCFEAQQGRVAALNVCKSHKEIVSGRLGLVNSFLICQPVFILPPKGELQHPNAFIYFLGPFSLSCYEYIHLSPTKQADAARNFCKVSHTHIHPVLTSNSSQKMHILKKKKKKKYTLCITPKWLVRTATVTDATTLAPAEEQQRQRERASDAALTAPGLP